MEGPSDSAQELLDDLPVSVDLHRPATGGQLQVGLMGSYGNFRYGYAITWETNRFKQQPTNQSFGSYFISYQFDF